MQVAPDLFAGFDGARFPASSLPALALAAHAYRRGAQLGERVSLALRHALFEEGRDISAPEVLADIAQVHGLERPTAEDRAAVLADWEAGRRRGVQGSPHYFVGDESFFCPALEITHVGARLHIAIDATGFETFVARAFPEAAASSL